MLRKPNLAQKTHNKNGKAKQPASGQQTKIKDYTNKGNKANEKSSKKAQKKRDAKQAEKATDEPIAQDWQAMVSVILPT